VRIASIFARDAGNIIKFKIEGKILNILSNTSQVGSNEAKVELLEESGKGGEIAFNYRYILEALSVIDGDEVVFEMIESLNPGKITSGNDPKLFHIVMPVRLQG
jgi:DNA polymerase-3 subunit beta